MVERAQLMKPSATSRLTPSECCARTVRRRSSASGWSGAQTTNVCFVGTSVLDDMVLLVAEKKKIWLVGTVDVGDDERGDS